MKPRRESSRDLTRERILATVDAIPRGCVATYGQIAEEAGLPRRARLVGRALSDLPSGSRLPWHRVVAAGGRIAVKGSAAREQRRRLVAEGLRFSRPGRVELGRSAWLP